MKSLVPLLLLVSCYAVPIPERPEPLPCAKEPPRTLVVAPDRALEHSFPNQVGGFRFGLTETEFKAACEAGDGVFTPGQAVSCSKPAVKLPFNVVGVYASFCDGRICAFQLLLPQWSQEDVLRFKALLTSRYGESKARDRYPLKCLSSREPIRSVWKFRNPAGEIHLIHDCARDNSELLTGLTYVSEEALLPHEIVDSNW